MSAAGGGIGDTPRKGGFWYGQFLVRIEKLHDHYFRKSGMNPARYWGRMLLFFAPTQMRTAEGIIAERLDMELPFLTHNADLLGTVAPQLDAELTEQLAQKNFSEQAKGILSIYSPASVREYRILQESCI